MLKSCLRRYCWQFLTFSSNACGFKNTQFIDVTGVTFSEARELPALVHVKNGLLSFAPPTSWPSLHTSEKPFFQ
jgi:hypothetical protein